MKMFLDIDMGDEKVYAPQLEAYQRAVQFAQLGPNYGLPASLDGIQLLY